MTFPTDGSRRFMRAASFASALFATLALACSSAARASEIQLDAGPTARASTWRRDFGAGGELRLGYRMVHAIAIDFVGWQEYLTVNRRLNTGLTFGVTGFLPFEKVRPSARLYVIHQHEESLVSVEDHPLGTVAGIGAGIRHRAGVGFALGVEIPLKKSSNVEYTFVSSGSLTWFPDATLGPRFYFGITAGLGLNYSLPGLP